MQLRSGYQLYCDACRDLARAAGLGRCRQALKRRRELLRGSARPPATTAIGQMRLASPAAGQALDKLIEAYPNRAPNVRGAVSLLAEWCAEVRLSIGDLDEAMVNTAFRQWLLQKRRTARAQLWYARAFVRTFRASGPARAHRTKIRPS